MTVPTKRLTEILIEVSTGQRPEKPDTPEEPKARADLKADVEKIRAMGGFIDIPFIE